MNLEGFAVIVFAAMLFAFTAILALLTGNAVAVTAIWLSMGAAYCAQVCFYSFVHLRYATTVGILFWVASVILAVVAFQQSATIIPAEGLL